jgi:hypothetical protein
MDTKTFRRMVVFGIGMAGVAGYVSADGMCARGYAQAASCQLAAAADSQPVESKKQESVRPPVQPVPAESRTPEEATKRAADPKDPSGALIIAPPAADNPKANR